MLEMNWLKNLGMNDLNMKTKMINMRIFIYF